MFVVFSGKIEHFCVCSTVVLAHSEASHPSPFILYSVFLVVLGRRGGGVGHNHVLHALAIRP